MAEVHDHPVFSDTTKRGQSLHEGVRWKSAKWVTTELAKRLRYALSTQGEIGLQQEALAAVFIHHREDAEGASVGQLIMDKNPSPSTDVGRLEGAWVRDANATFASNVISADF